MKWTLACMALLLASAAAGAQQRRSAGGPPPEPREIIDAIPRFPYTGTWHGQMKLRLDVIPVSVDIDVQDGKYTSVSYGPGGGRMKHQKTELSGTSLRWEIPNSGGGFWLYEATKVAGDTIYGQVALKNYPGRDGSPEAGTILLVRQRK